MSNFENDPQFEQLKSRLQQNPDSLIFARVAEGLLNRGQVEEAIRICEEGIRKHPYYITGHMVLGKCYLQKKLFDLAEKEFKRVLLFDPKYIAAHKFYGDLMREVGWENTCEMSYRKILQIDPLDRTAKEMLETLEKVKPRETEVVTPETDTDAEIGAVTPAEEDQAGTEAIDDALAAVETVSPPQPPEAEPIDLDDDLFAEAKSEIETPVPEADAETQNEPAIDDTDVSGILEDIFEEETTEEEAPRLEEFTMGQEGEAQQSPVVTETQPEPQPVEEVQTPPVVDEHKTDDDPLKTLDQFEEDTLEIESFDPLHDEASQPGRTSAQDEEDLATREFLESATAQETDESEEEQDLFAALDSLSSSDQTEGYGRDSDWDQALNIDTPDSPAAEDKQDAEPAVPSAVDEDIPVAGGADLPEPPSVPMSENEPAQPEVSASADETVATGAPTAAEPAESSATLEKTAPPETDEQQQSGTAGADSANNRERIVTPTLGEIYAAQGQFAKAINVFEMLLKKDPNNAAYKEKIEMLKKRLEENQNGG